MSNDDTAFQTLRDHFRNAASAAGQVENIFLKVSNLEKDLVELRTLRNRDAESAQSILLSATAENNAAIEREVQKRRRAAECIAAVKQDVEEELWKIAARLHDHETLVQNHLVLQKRFEEANKILDTVTAQAATDANRANVAETKVRQLSPSAGEHILLSSPDVVFLTIVAFCTPQTLAALSRSCRAVHGRVGYAVRVARASRDLDITDSNSSSLLMPKITQAAKNGILRAVHAIHAWSPHMGSSSFAPQKASNLSQVTQDDSFSLGESALSSENTDISASGSMLRGRTGSIVSGSVTLSVSAGAIPPSIPSPATSNTSSTSGGIFGFGSRRPATSGVGSTSQQSEKDVTGKQKGGGNLFISPNKPEESNTSASNAGGPVDYKKVEDLMLKLKAANSNLLNLKRTSDDVRMKLETAEGVKKHLAQQVRQLEESITTAVRDRDTALHEKSQNLEVIRFLDDRVASLEARLESTLLSSKESLSTIQEKDAANNGLQLRIAHLEDDNKKAKTSLSEAKAHLAAADARVADAEARAQALESLAMNLSPDMLLDGGVSFSKKSAAQQSTAAVEEATSQLRYEIEKLNADKKLLNAELLDLKAKRDTQSRETAVWSDERGEVPGLKIEISRTRKERDELTKQVQILTEECDVRKSRINILERDVEALTSKLSENASNIINSLPPVVDHAVDTAIIEQLRAEHTADVAFIEQLRAEHAAESQSWKQARTLLAKEVKKLRTELADLQARFGVSTVTASEGGVE